MVCGCGLPSDDVSNEACRQCSQHATNSIDGNGDVHLYVTKRVFERDLYGLRGVADEGRGLNGGRIEGGGGGVGDLHLLGC